MPFGGANSERILILAPRGRDADVASQLLQEAGWPTLVCADVVRLSEEIAKGAGCAVVVEDVIASDDISALAGSINAQPPWSDFPMVVLTARADRPERNVLAIRLQDALGNVTFLERPFHPTTLVNIVRAASAFPSTPIWRTRGARTKGPACPGTTTSHQKPPCCDPGHRLCQPARKPRKRGIF